MPTVLLTTPVANATALPRTSSAATPAPFCLNCAFNFGHIIDGMEDSAAGALVVSIFVIMLAAICFAVGCYAHVLRTHRKVYAAVKSVEDTAETADSDTAVVVDDSIKKPATKKKK